MPKAEDYLESILKKLKNFMTKKQLENEYRDVCEAIQNLEDLLDKAIAKKYAIEQSLDHEDDDNEHL